MNDSFRMAFRTRLVDLLFRLQQAHPFPLDPMEVYKAAFPESKLADWCLDPKPTDMRKASLPYRNLHACTRLDSIVHFSLNTQAELDAMTDLSDHSMFWIRFPTPVVSPWADGTFMLSEAMRENPTLNGWFYSAMDLGERIAVMTLKIYQLAEKFANPSEVVGAWPEVVKAAPHIMPPAGKARIASRSPRIPLLREEVLRRFPPDQMELLSDMLATAIMLPSDAVLSAWPGVFTEGDDIP
jgi:hypothetical protein